MDEPASASGGLRESAERLVLAALGAVALTADRIDQLADGLAGRGSLSRDEARETIEGLALRWRGEAARFGERTGAGLENVVRELGLVTRREYDELELRVAQLEHRLRLVEGTPRAVPEPRS